VSLNAGRAWRFAAITLLTFPLFFATESVLRALHDRDNHRIRRVLRAFTIGFGYFGLITLSMVAVNEWLMRLSLYVLAFATLLQAFSCILYEVTKSSLLTSVFQCLMIAWILSIGFSLY